MLQNRWWLAFAAMGLVFIGRLALNLLREGDVPSRLSSTLDQAKASLPLMDFGRWLAPAMIAFAVVLPFMPFSDRYVMDVSILVLTYVMLGWGLNIVVGLAGLLDLGYVAFYAVGAYAFALIAINFDLGFWLCLPIAGALWRQCGGMILGFPVLRLRGRLSRHRDPCVRRDHSCGSVELGRFDQRAERYLGNSEAHPFRVGIQGIWRQYLRRILWPQLLAAATHRLSLLHHPGSGADHLPNYDPIAQTADRARLGSAPRR